MTDAKIKEYDNLIQQLLSSLSKIISIDADTEYTDTAMDPEISTFLKTYYNATKLSDDIILLQSSSGSDSSQHPSLDLFKTTLKEANLTSRTINKLSDQTQEHSIPEEWMPPPRITSQISSASQTQLGQRPREELESQEMEDPPYKKQRTDSPHLNISTADIQDMLQSIRDLTSQVRANQETNKYLRTQINNLPKREPSYNAPSRPTQSSLPVHNLTNPIPHEFFFRAPAPQIVLPPLTESSEYIRLPKMLTTNEALTFHPKNLLKDHLFSPTNPRNQSSISLQRSKVITFFNTFSEEGTICEEDQSYPDGLKWDVIHLKRFLLRLKAPPPPPPKSDKIALARYNASRLPAGTVPSLSSDFHLQHIQNIAHPVYQSDRLYPTTNTHLLSPSQKKLYLRELQQDKGKAYFPGDHSTTPKTGWYRWEQFTHQRTNPDTNSDQTYHLPNLSYAGRLAATTKLFPTPKDCEDSMIRGDLYDRLLRCEATGTMGKPRSMMEFRLTYNDTRELMEMITALISVGVNTQSRLAALSPPGSVDIESLTAFHDVILNRLQVISKRRYAIIKNKEPKKLLPALMTSENNLFTTFRPTKRQEPTPLECTIYEDLKHLPLTVRNSLQSSLHITAHSSSHDGPNRQMVAENPKSTREDNLKNLRKVSSKDLATLSPETTYLKSTTILKTPYRKAEKVCTLRGCKGCDYGHHNQRKELRFGQLGPDMGVPKNCALLTS